MERYKKLFSNTLIFTISQFASKLLSVFLLPLYTSYLSPQDYGISDLINSTVLNLLIPIGTLLIANAVLRFTFEKNNARSEVFKIGFLFTVISCFCMLLFCFALKSQESLKPYLVLFYLTYVVYAFDSFWDNFAKGIDEIKLIAITGVLKTLLVIAFNLLFLVYAGLGVKGYLLSYILALFLSDLFLSMRLHFWNYVSFGKIDKDLLKQMLLFCIPLVPGGIGWWLNGTVNKYIVTYICGAAALGLFSVASKIPGIISVVQSFFAQALVLSVIESYDDEPQSRDRFYTELYHLYFFIMTVSASVLIIFTQILAGILFANNFYSAWKYVPFLLIGAVFGAISGYLGTFYSASKETKGIFTSTIKGAIAAVVLNILLVPQMGVMGATVANCISTGMIWLIRIIETRKFVKLKISPLQQGGVWGVLILQAIGLITIKNLFFLYLSEVVLFVFLIVMNKKSIILIVIKAKELIKNKS